MVLRRRRRQLGVGSSLDRRHPPTAHTVPALSTAVVHSSHCGLCAVRGTGTHSIDLSTMPTACEQLALANATNSIHIKYFLQQQAEEARMLELAERGLCSGSPDEHTYQQRLGSLLRPYRMATRLHVPTAHRVHALSTASGALFALTALHGM
jgi:hypothetical protein